MSETLSRDARLHVLIVEDEPRLRELLTDVIPGMGFTATGCRSAEEAYSQFDEINPQIMILDMNLPGMSGIEFLEKVREKHKDVQAIILTGYGDLPAAKKAIRLDIVDFLSKPCPLGELEIALSRARRRFDDPDELPDLDSPFLGDREKLDLTKPHTLEEVERQLILDALERNDGNRTATALELGISRRTLYYRLAEYEKQGFLEG